MKSERKIRNGYMGLVVKVSNKLQSKTPAKEDSDNSKTAPNAASSTNNQNQEDQTVIEYLERVGDEWTTFVDGELAESNEKNNRTLGGTTRPNNDYDDNDDNSYEV